MIPGNSFPRLTPENHRVTSPATAAYNCIAWAAGDTDRWWQPGSHWPIVGHGEDYGLGMLMRAFVAIGFEECEDGRQEPDIERVALYGSPLIYTHAARQLSDGKWTSKLGRSEDIEHNSPDDMAGGVYGEVVQFMKRSVKVDSQQT